MSGSVVLFYRPSLSRLGDPHLKNRLFMRMKILRYAADRDNRFGDVRTTVSDLRRGVYIRFVPCLLRRMTSDKTQLLKAYAGQSTEIAYHQDNSYIWLRRRYSASVNSKQVLVYSRLIRIFERTGRRRNGRPETVWETVKTESVMNVVLDSLKTRRSIRGYDPDRMPAEELIGQIIEAGTYAPTGRGMQSPRIVVVTERTVRDRLSALNAAVMGSASDPFYGAPVVLVVLADRSRPTYLYDGSLVMGNLVNAAHAVGLGSCWIHREKEMFITDEGKEMIRS